MSPDRLKLRDMTSERKSHPSSIRWLNCVAAALPALMCVEVIGGIFDFWGLIDGGFLTADGTEANGIDDMFNRCSQTVSHQKERSKSVSSID